MNICIIYKFFSLRVISSFSFVARGCFLKFTASYFSIYENFPETCFKYTPQKKSKVDIVKQG